jgi:hypothetical protein
MKTYLLVVLSFGMVMHLSMAKISHLLVTSIGDGIVGMDSSKEEKVISSSSFLPQSTPLHVKPKSGIETLAAGYQFRFGASTSFQCLDDSLELLSGSLFIRSRNIKNKVDISGPEISVIVSGSGSSLIQVEPNGGLKCVGLLGSLKLSTHKDTIVLLPGELVFTDLKASLFSDKVTVDLQNLFETSFLISGFMNSSSFESALRNVAKLQKNAIGKSYNASVGSANNLSNFEIVSRPDSNTPAQSGISFLKKEDYELPSESPLDELLGRGPQRMDRTAILTTDSDSSSEPSPENPSINRPFPSRLLRGN